MAVYSCYFGILFLAEWAILADTETTVGAVAGEAEVLLAAAAIGVAGEAAEAALMVAVLLGAGKLLFLSIVK